MRRWQTGQKLLLTMLILSLVAFASACSQGVSTTEYNQAQTKVSNLENENSGLKQQIADLKRENENLRAQIPTPVPTRSPSTQQIVVTYSSVLTQGFFKPPAGSMDLMINMTVENQGYDSFDTGSYGDRYAMSFCIVANGVKYYVAGAQTSILESYLPAQVIPNGGKASGTLVFVVPAATTTFSLQYIGSETYNIQWVKQ